MRLIYIDCLKGFLIILVIIGHIIQMNDVDFTNNIIYRYIYSTHMPLFFVVSGFLSYKERLFLKDLKKRVFQLLLPFFTWWFLHWLFESKLDFFYSLINLIKNPDYGLWFLWVLFFCILLLHLVDRVSDYLKFRKEIVTFISAILLYMVYIMTNFRLLGFQFIAWFFMFYCLGFYLRKFQIVFFSKINFLLLMSLILFPISAWFSVIKGNPLFYAYYDFGLLFSYVYKFIVAILGSILAFTLLNKIVKIFDDQFWIVRALVKLGKMTLGIYAIHFTFLPIIQLNRTQIPIELISIIILAFTIIISFVSILLIRKNKILALFLLGERKIE